MLSWRWQDCRITLQNGYQHLRTIRSYLVLVTYIPCFTSVDRVGDRHVIIIPLTVCAVCVVAIRVR